MAMVDRYKKPGGFIQLLQVIETCGPKKQEQFMSIITEEAPSWSSAIQQKMLTFEKIISWKSEAILEIVAHINTLTFVTALKSLPQDKMNSFCEKLSAQEKRKIDQQYKELNPDINQMSSCVMKVVSETRNLFLSGALKYEKIDLQMAIPENYEAILDGGSQNLTSAQVENSATSQSGIGSGHTLDFEQLKKKYIELNQQVNALKKENIVMKEKLDRIKKIA